MSSRRLIDTNLIVRHLVQDHEKHAREAAKLFDACDSGVLVLVVHPAVLAECVFVLESFYEHPRRDIAAAMAKLIGSPGVESGDADVYLDALSRYGRTKVHFVDCIIAAAARDQRVSVATLDQDFRKFPDVRVEVR